MNPRPPASLMSPANDAVTRSENRSAQGEWTEDAWRKIFREVTPSMQSVLVQLALNPGEVFTMSELAGAIGSEPGTVRNALSSFTKRMRKYGLTEWPFTYVKDNQTGRYSYEMDAETAASVLEISGLAKLDGPSTSQRAGGPDAS